MNKLDPLVLSQQGFPLLFYHANGYPPEAYRIFLGDFLKEYHVQAMYLRPFWPGADPLSLRDWLVFRDDYSNYLDSLSKNLKQEKNSFPQVIGVGHSVGAMTTIMAAIEKPELFKTLVLIEPVLFPRWQGVIMRCQAPLNLIKRFHPLIQGTLRRKTHFPDKESMYQNYRGKSVFENFSDQVLRDYVDGLAGKNTDGTFSLKYTPVWEARIYETGGIADWYVWRNLAKVKCPVLVIRGENSDTLRDQTMRKMVNKLPRGRAHTIPDAGHLVPLESPRQTAETILEFLAEKP